MTEAEKGTSTGTVPTSSPLPYEAELSKAFDKLTSQIFIFLLAYTILLVGLVFLGKSIPEPIRVLLYIIPVLGVLFYTFEKRRQIAQKADKHGISVGVLFASDHAYVGGVRGSSGAASPPDVSVRGGVVTGGATVVGFDAAPPMDSNKKAIPENEEDFWNVYGKLNKKNRTAVIASAMQLYAEQLRSR